MHQIFKIFLYIFQLYSIITERKNIAFLYLIEFLSSGVLLLPSQLHIEKLYLTCVIIGKLYIIIWRFGLRPLQVFPLVLLERDQYLSWVSFGKKFSIVPVYASTSYFWVPNRTMPRHWNLECHSTNIHIWVDS